MKYLGDTARPAFFLYYLWLLLLSNMELHSLGISSDRDDMACKPDIYSLIIYSLWGHAYAAKVIKRAPPSWLHLFTHSMNTLSIYCVSKMCYTMYLER